MAAQLMATNGRSARGLLRWMAWATSSFPVPLSPWIRTVESVGATRRMNSNTFAHGGTAADHVVFQFDFSAQFLILQPQLFPVTHVVKSQAGDARDRGHHLQVVFVELCRRTGAVHIDRAQNLAGSHQRNAKQAAYFQFRQGS